MTWLLWRQHRAQMLIVTGLLAVFAVPLWTTGRHLSDALTACRSSGSCGGILTRYNAITTTVDLTVAVPLIFGIFWGVSVVGRELEAGTATLAWTQTVTRRRWLASKLLWLFGATLAASTALSAMVTWWSNTRNVLQASRFSGLQFDLQALSPVGYSLFSAALGLLAGVAWRRTLPAVATTIAGFVGVRMFVELALRPDYMAPVQRLVSMSARPDGPAGSWSRSNELVRNGRALPGNVVHLPGSCARPGGRVGVNQCMDALGYRVRETYQPAGRYWAFQWIEFGIFAGLAVILVAGAVVLLRRRDV